MSSLAGNFGKAIGNNTPALVGVTSSGTRIFAQPVVLEAAGVGGIALGKDALGKNVTGLVFSRFAGFKDDMQPLHEGQIDEVNPSGHGDDPGSGLPETDEALGEKIFAEEPAVQGKPVKKPTKKQMRSDFERKKLESDRALRTMADEIDEAVNSWEAEIIRFYNREARYQNPNLKYAVEGQIEMIKTTGTLTRSELANSIYEMLLEFGFDPPVKPLMP